MTSRDLSRLLVLTLGLAGAALAAVALTSAQAMANPANEAAVKAHLDAAEQAAGTDLKVWLRLCRPASPARPTVTDDSLAKLIATPGPAAAAAFDTLFYLGSGWVSAWALKTSDGIVLIDALNTAAEVDQLIVGGMKRLGLDPAQIKVLLVTHGHGDHYGGALRVKEIAATAQPRVVMSELDWTMTRTQLEFASPLWPAAPRFDSARDVAARDGDVLRQGDAQVLLPITAGHTMGTISPIVEVHAGKRTHRAMIWGGTSFNFGRDLPRLEAYIQSTVRMQQLVREQRVDVLLSNHPSYDDTVEKLPKVQAVREAGAPHPFVVGTDVVLRALTVAGECARANKVRFEMRP